LDFGIGGSGTNGMKLEKVVSKPRKGLWIGLFIVVLTIAGVMATSYNFEIVQNVKIDVPWTKIVLGSLGFITIIGALLLFFMRLLREMRVSQIQADFLDRISHELRTPLATISLVSDLLRDPSTSPEEAKKLWKSHESELARLKSDVELLLQAGHLRESKLRINTEPVQLEKWLSEQWSGFSELLGANADFKKTGSLNAGWVSLDLNLFELIFRNLLDNERKFSIERPKVEIKCSTFKSGFLIRKNNWRIEIVDQGLGFEPESRGDLFKRFSRIPLINTELKPTSVPGTGLGLYLSASASRAMGITLQGRSLGEGKGAEFILEGTFS
jgi:signal transduction histidine kinase